LTGWFIPLAAGKKNAVRKPVSWLGIRLIHGIVTMFSRHCHSVVTVLSYFVLYLR